MLVWTNLPYAQNATSGAIAFPCPRFCPSYTHHDMTALHEAGHDGGERRHREGDCPGSDRETKLRAVCGCVADIHYSGLRIKEQGIVVFGVSVHAHPVRICTLSFS